MVENETVTITEKQMEAIDKEITKVDTQKLEEAKKSGIEEAKKEILPTLEEIKRRSEEIERKMALKELEEKERTLKALEEAETHRKGVVAHSANPIAPKKEVIPDKMPEIGWENLEGAFKNGFKGSAR